MASHSIMSNVLSEPLAGRRLVNGESKGFASRKAHSWRALRSCRMSWASGSPAEGWRSASRRTTRAERLAHGAIQTRRMCWASEWAAAGGPIASRRANHVKLPPDHDDGIVVEW